MTPYKFACCAKLISMYQMKNTQKIHCEEIRNGKIRIKAKLT